MTFSTNSSGGKYKSSQLNNGDSAYGLRHGAENVLIGYEDRTIILNKAISQTHNEQSANVSLMQPYIVVYFWRRTA